MRRLASIAIINDLKPIIGADRIELARIYNWQVVVKKGEFSINDRCVYFEVDSLLPDEDRYSFLGNTIKFNNKPYYRLKTRRLRKVYSQGLALPMTYFPELIDYDTYEDVTKKLNVEKYEKVDLPLGGNISGNFPNFIPKTKLENVQNIAYLPYQEYEITEKLEGTSCTYYKYGNEIGVCSKNYKLKLDKDTVYSYVFYKGIDKILELLSPQNNFALQGEIIAPKVQGNIYRRSEPEFYLYDIYDIDSKKYLTYEHRKRYVDSLNNGGYNLKTVPFLGTTGLILDYFTCQICIDEADGYSLLNLEQLREGLVFKSLSTDARFKVRSQKYLELADS